MKFRFEKGTNKLMMVTESSFNDKSVLKAF